MSILTALFHAPAASASQPATLSNGLGSKASGPKAAAAGSSGSGSGSTSGTDAFSVNNLGSTFLNLLVQELQNQDPTSPMDPTAMVGQMISLNQLSQLISINQALTPSSATTASGGTAAAGARAASAVQAALDALSPAAAVTGSGSAAASQAGTFQPGALAAAEFFGQGKLNGTPASPIDLSHFNFAGGK